MPTPSTNYERLSLEVEGEVLAVHAWRAPSAQANCLFWHGLGAYSGLHANELAPPLNAVGINVYAPDAPGFGASSELPRESYRFTEIGSIAAALAHAVSESPIYFIGHSWGAHVGMACTYVDPALVSALVLLDGGYVHPPRLSWETYLRSAREIDEMFSFADVESFLASERESVPRWTPELADADAAAVGASGGRIRMIQRPHVAAAIREGLTEIPPEAQYEAIRGAGIPVLLLTATEPGGPTGEQRDRDVSDFISRLVNATVAQVPKARHILIDDAAPTVAKMTISWMTANALLG